MTFISTNSSSAFWEVFCLDLLASFIAKVPFKLETEASPTGRDFIFHSLLESIYVFPEQGQKDGRATFINQ